MEETLSGAKVIRNTDYPDIGNKPALVLELVERTNDKTMLRAIKKFHAAREQATLINDNRRISVAV